MDAIYARQSVDKKDSISIDTQIELCKKECAIPEVIEIYADKGYSGSNLKRPEFQRLLDDVKAGKITRIITYRLDRISRSVLDFGNLMVLFEQHGVSFNSTMEKFDTSTPIGRAMLSITMVFAQLERETIQQRIRDNYYARGEKGMFLGGPAPFGFIKVEAHSELGKLKMLEENPGTIGILKQLYQMYGNEMMTLGEIARNLNEESVPSPNGTIWDSCKVSRILRNPVAVKADIDVFHYYQERGVKFTNEPVEFTLDKGCYLYGKRESNERKYTDVKDHILSLAPHEGVIEPDLFLRVQRRLDENKQIDNRRKSQITWLTGLIKCGKCGYSAIPKSSCNGKYTYIYCTGKTSYSCCDIDGNLGALNAVEAVIEDRIIKWAKQYSDIKAEITVSDNRERNRLQCRIEELNQEIQKSVAALIQASEVSAKYINERIEELDRECKMLVAELNNHTESNHGETLNKEISDLPGAWSSLSVQQKNSIASLLISRINLLKNEIEIEWSYDFDIQ
ncbi:MAG: recombinase family protein [Clostridiales bacterium]|nr:recombinase family protein [Clostridiales bacterium]